jgi:hypothetical protein
MRKSVDVGQAPRSDAGVDHPGAHGVPDRIGLAEGITSTVTWYREHAGVLREAG